MMTDLTLFYSRMSTERMIERWKNVICQYDRTVRWSADGDEDDTQRLAEVSASVIEDARYLIERLLGSERLSDDGNT